MSDVRWRKVLRDLWLHKARSVLVVVAISAGLAGAGAILNTWALIKRVTKEAYLASNPASATIRTDSVDAPLLARVRAVPGVRDAQGRRTVMGSARGPGGWSPAMLFAMDDFSAARIGKLRPEAGAWPPADGAMTIERSSLSFSGAAVGEPLAVVVGESEPVPLAVSGIARDVGLAPGWMEHIVYAFVTPETLRRLGAPSSLSEIQIVVADAALDQDGVRRIAFAVKAAVEGTGRRVSDVDVSVPGQHIHAAQMDSLLYTQGAFALLALVLSCFLVVNLIAAMLASQVREIGVMKAIGARPGQIAVMYLGMALAIGLISTALSVPVAAYVGHKYAEFKAELLNFDVTGYAIPGSAIALQILVGALLPVAAAAIPVVRGCRISVAEAIRDFGMSRGGPPGPLLARASGVARPLLLSLRNAFRRRQRMALTLLTLSTGGAVYLGALNLRASVRGAVDLLYVPMRFQLVLRLAQPWPAESLETAMRAVAGVRRAEAISGARATAAHADGTSGNPFAISAVMPGSPMYGYTTTAGRWLQSGDSNVLVVSRGLLKSEPHMSVGANVSLVVGGQPGLWTIVGVTEAGPAPMAFAPRGTVANLVAAGRVDRAVVATEVAGDAAQVELIQRLRGELDRRGFQVQSSQLLAEGRRVMEDHLLMVADFLGIMGWVMIVVGGLGLASTMGLAVLERTREIGVMRAIGARHRAIHLMVQTEGLVIGLLSWAMAIPLSIPMSVILGRAFGRVMIPVPLTWLPDLPGVGGWLLVVVVVSILACAWPAIRATRITTAAALAYE